MGTVASFENGWLCIPVSGVLAKEQKCYFMWNTEASVCGNADFPSQRVVVVKVAQSCLTLCDPMDYTVHGILQARTLEWVAYPFSSRRELKSKGNSEDWCVCDRQQCGAACALIWGRGRVTRSPWMALGGHRWKSPPKRFLNLLHVYISSDTVMGF